VGGDDEPGALQRHAVDVQHGAGATGPLPARTKTPQPCRVRAPGKGAVKE
jgi:hypothetical protein